MNKSKQNREIVLAATLSSSCSLYGQKLEELAYEFGSLEKLYKEWHSGSKRIPSSLRALLNAAWNETHLQSMKSLLATHAIEGVVVGSQDYPHLLKEIPDRPYVLYILGSLVALKGNHIISCVGTRTMSLYGKRAVNTLLPPLKDYPTCIVSGLALGVDAESHRAALAHGLPTVAVLGGGLDRYEPLTNYGLAVSILKNKGCLLSEYPPGVRPQKHHFLARNRIIAGLSTATIIIEGKESSGSLVTARAALSYGREVGAVPGDIFSPTTFGPHQLLRDGAWPLVSYHDILAMIGLEVQDTPGEDNTYGEIYAHLLQQPSTLDSLCLSLQDHLSRETITEQLLDLELDGKLLLSATGEYSLIGSVNLPVTQQN